MSQSLLRLNVHIGEGESVLTEWLESCQHPIEENTASRDDLCPVVKKTMAALEIFRRPNHFKLNNWHVEDAEGQIFNHTQSKEDMCGRDHIILRRGSHDPPKSM